MVCLTYILYVIFYEELPSHPMNKVSEVNRKKKCNYGWSAGWLIISSSSGRAVSTRAKIPPKLII